MINKILLSLIAVLCLDATVTAQNNDRFDDRCLGTLLAQRSRRRQTEHLLHRLRIATGRRRRTNPYPRLVEGGFAHDRRRGGDRHGHHPFGEDARILRVDRQVGRTDQGARRQRPQRPVR